MSKTQQKSSKIGLNKIHFAIYYPNENKFSVPERFTTIKEMTVTTNTAEANEYNDDGLFEVLDTFDNFEVTLTFTDLTPSEQAKLLGWESKGAVKLSGANDNAPWVALIGERFKKDNTKRYFKYFKGKASLESETSSTKGDKVEAQPDSIKITFGALPDDFPIKEYRSMAKALLDESDPEYNDEGETWYDEVIEGCTMEEETAENK